MKLEIKNVFKNYGKHECLKGVSLEIDKSGIYGLLGKNGVGKTTLLNIITNRKFCDSGQILLDGVNLVDNEELLNNIHCCFLPELFLEELRIKKLAYWTSRFNKEFDMDYFNLLMDKFQIEPKYRIRKLSTGKKTALYLSLTLASNKNIMIFDEPTTGLDALSRDIFYKELLKTQDKLNNIIILSTHLIDEVSQLLTDIFIMENGKVIISSDYSEFMNQYYRVSGTVEAVNNYLINKEVISSTTYKATKVSLVKGVSEEDNLVTIDKPSLQDIFIGLIAGDVYED